MRNTLMRSLALAALLAATAACQTAAMPAPTASSAHIVAAIADPARPAADSARDTDRKPAEMITFGEVSPGDKVGELIPGGGYMTRILSKAVGASGKIYVFASAPVQREGQPPPAAPVAAITADAANYGNVQLVITDFTTIAAPEPLISRLRALTWTVPPGPPAPGARVCALIPARNVLSSSTMESLCAFTLTLPPAPGPKVLAVIWASFPIRSRLASMVRFPPVPVPGISGLPLTAEMSAP